MKPGMNLQDVRIAKLEHTAETMTETPMEHTNAKFEEQSAQIREKVQSREVTPQNPENSEFMTTIVVGGLQT